MTKSDMEAVRLERAIEDLKYELGDRRSVIVSVWSEDLRALLEGRGEKGNSAPAHPTGREATPELFEQVRQIILANTYVDDAVRAIFRAPSHHPAGKGGE